ncbi:MAG: PDZ domain-containing protein [Microbacteriaceae bacterium]|nr:PDZ domain-containing protein [Microbacteriaceae bacterium]
MIGPASRHLPRVARAFVTAAATSVVVAAANYVAPVPTQSVVLGVEISGSSESPRGARVGDVTAGSPASETGLLPGDVITNLNGTPIRSAADFSTAIGQIELGDWIALSFSGATGAFRAAVLPLEEHLDRRS